VITVFTEGGGLFDLLFIDLVCKTLLESEYPKYQVFPPRQKSILGRNNFVCKESLREY
jgi:hypothetical protein